MHSSHRRHENSGKRCSLPGGYVTAEKTGCIIFWLCVSAFFCGWVFSGFSLSGGFRYCGYGWAFPTLWFQERICFRQILSTESCGIQQICSLQSIHTFLWLLVSYFCMLCEHLYSQQQVPFFGGVLCEIFLFEQDLCIPLPSLITSVVEVNHPRLCLRPSVGFLPQLVFFMLEECFCVQCEHSPFAHNRFHMR